jgi:hypothetical protein
MGWTSRSIAGLCRKKVLASFKKMCFHKAETTAIFLCAKGFVSTYPFRFCSGFRMASFDMISLNKG